jgi:hypothetical protein
MGQEIERLANRAAIDYMVLCFMPLLIVIPRQRAHYEFLIVC